MFVFRLSVLHPLYPVLCGRGPFGLGTSLSPGDMNISHWSVSALVTVR